MLTTRIAAVALITTAYACAAPGSLALTSSVNPSVFGQSVTLTATVSTPNAVGNITFYDGFSILGIRPLLSGQATLTTFLLPTGNRSVRAYYAGDSSYATLSQQVNSAPANGFQPAVNYKTDSTPMSVVVGDFNGDGIADLVVANQLGSGNNNGDISVLLGKGDGTFQPAVNYIAGVYPSFVAVGDLNGDGNDDLAIANTGSNNISVLLGNGDGTFQPAVNFPAGASPSSLAIGDFNEDGKADLAVTVNNNVSVMLGNGDGSFQTPLNYAVGPTPFSIALGDFDGDGHVDLAVANAGGSSSGNIKLLLGRGDGSFQNASNIGSGPVPYYVVAGDLNGDGKSDLVFADVTSRVGVLLGNGDGTFQPALLYPTSIAPFSMAVGDINGDGKLDVITASFGSTAVSVLLGNGDGTLQLPANYFAGSTPRAVAVGDFNGDGKADLVLANRGSGNVSILLGTVLAPSTITLASSVNPSSFSQNIILTATVSPSTATGSVSFFDGALPLGTSVLVHGVAAFQPIQLATGEHILGVAYSGDSTYAASASTPLDQVVNPLQTATLLSSSSNPAKTGQNLVLTATVTPTPNPVGSVTFYDGATVLGSKNIANGQASVNVALASGTHSLTASFSGSPQYTGSTSPMVLEFVSNLQMPSSLTLASSRNPSVYGQPVSLTATVAPSTANGRVSFYDGTTVLGTAILTSGQASLTTVLPSGTRGLKAYYSGDGNDAASASAIVSQTVNAAAANGFLPAANYALSSTPQVVVAADFNADGKQDLALLNENTRTVSLLLANGDGTFQKALIYPVAGASPVSMVTGDFNGDGKSDLAIANLNGFVSVLLGNGDGSFQPALSFYAGINPAGIAVGDFNADGSADLVVPIFNGVSVLLGNGDGTFQPAASYQVAGSPTSIAVGDFNGDGKADVTVCFGVTVTVLLGNGDGTLQQAVSFAGGSTGGQFIFTAVGDFNGDGKADLALANVNATNVSVLLGNGDGTFQPAKSFTVGPSPRSIAVGDFNGDGKVDLAVADSAKNLVSILPGNGDGTFQAAINYTTGNSPYSVAAGDFNGDGKTDLAVANLISNSVSVLLGRFATASTITLAVATNPSNFGQAVKLTATLSPASASGRVTFYDGVTVLGTGTLANGQASMATSLLASGSHALKAYYSGDASNMASTSAVLAQTVGVAPVPADGFPVSANFGAGLEPLSVAVADFNGDGKADVAIANFGGVTGGGSVSILLGKGDGTFQTAVNYAAGNGPIAVAVGDINADGKADVVVSNYTDNTVSVLLGNGDGTFQTALNFAAGTAPIALAIGDFNQDGKPDLAVIDYPGGSILSVLLGNGDGTFQAPVSYNGSSFARCVAVGDFNGDGIADLAIGSSFTVSILLGNGDGTFQSPLTAAGGLFYSVVVGDFNGDGKADIAATYYTAGLTVVLLGNGDGSFQIPVNYATGTYPRSIVSADFNGDGKTDLAVASFGGLTGGTVSVLSGNGDGTFQPAVNYPSSGNPTAIGMGDFNGDGAPDLVVSNQNNNVSVLFGGFLPVTTITLDASPNPSKTGQNVTMTATVSPANATGQVTFFDGATALGGNFLVGGKASLNVKLAPPAPHRLKATYGGSSAYAASTSGIVTQTFSGTLASNTILLTSSSNPSNASQPVTLTATLFPAEATGWVTFYDGGTVLGSQLLANGQSLLTTSWLASGTRSLKVYYSGDANYVANNSTVLSQTVQPAVSSGLQSATTYATGKNPFAAAAGDFNGDSKLDLAVANAGDNTVSVLLGNGDGTFQTAVSYPAGSYPYSVAVGDFNGDGIADLAVANNGGNDVSVLLGKGDGTFQAAMHFGAGHGPYAIAVGDFNNDGWLDLSVVNQLSNNVSILLGNGNGTFQTPVNYAAGNYPDSVAIVDLSGDGIPDLLVADQFGQVSLLTGHADGTFQSGGFVNVGNAASLSGPTGIVAGDFNGDGKSDYAVSSYGGGVQVELLTLVQTPLRNFAAGVNPWSLALGDIDGDGKLDLVVVNEGGNNLSVLPGKGDGTFLAPVNYDVGQAPVAVVIGDFNGDGRPDVVVVNNLDNSVSVLLGR